MGYRYYRVILVKADIIAMVYSQNIRIFWIMPVCRGTETDPYGRTPHEALGPHPGPDPRPNPGPDPLQWNSGNIISDP